VRILVDFHIVTRSLIHFDEVGEEHLSIICAWHPQDFLTLKHMQCNSNI